VFSGWTNTDDLRPEYDLPSLEPHAVLKVTAVMHRSAPVRRRPTSRPSRSRRSQGRTSAPSDMSAARR